MRTAPGGLFALLLLALLLLSPCGAQSQSGGGEQVKLRTLTTASEAHNLSSEEAGRAYPVHFRAVITYYDPRIGSHRSSLFVHDSTGSIYVELAEGSFGDLSAGMLIDLQGVSGPGEFGPIVAQPHIKVLGYGPIPANAPRESLTRLKTGAEDGQWIEAEGIVRSYVDYGHSVMLQLAMEGGTVSVVMVKEAGAPYAGLVDAKVRIRANAAPTFNSSLQMIGVRLMCPGLAAVQIVETPSSDPFNLPVTPINRLLRWDQVNHSLHRTHLRGIVTLQWPGVSLCIHDGTRGICAQTAQETPVAAGDDVDVVGFAGAEGSAPVLTDAVFRIRSAGKPLAARPVSAEQALLGRDESELIQIEGKLIGSDVEDSDTILLLDSGKTIFTAALPKNMVKSVSNTWTSGSILRVTGICSVLLDEQRSAIGEGMAVPRSFRILMRSPADVTVLDRPSWWTTAHALALLGLAIAITLIVLGWVMALRRRVKQQTHLLRESEQRFRFMALHDALTGVASRLLLEDRLNSAVESARRHQTGLGLLMVDLDKFKEINDTYGHRAGDEVLRVTASRLLDAVRKTDTVARMGGDEFLVLLAELSNQKMAEKIAAIIVNALAEPVNFEDHKMAVSASVGVSTAVASELDAVALLRNVDKALYRAKMTGRNRYEVYIADSAVAEKVL